MSKMQEIIQKTVGGASTAKTASADQVIADFVSDLISGAPSAAVEMDKEGYEMKLASAGLSPLQISTLAGALQACEEAGLTLKEASEYLTMPESVLQAVAAVALK